MSCHCLYQLTQVRQRAHAYIVRGSIADPVLYQSYITTLTGIEKH